MVQSSVSGRLTTHVLDTAKGCPAEGILIELFAIDGENRRLIASTKTNSDGRTNEPMLAGIDFQPGIYELMFHAGDYIRNSTLDVPDVQFLSTIPVRFGIMDAETHYHVPLLVSPYGYSTYRGS